MTTMSRQSYYPHEASGRSRPSVFIDHTAAPSSLTGPATSSNVGGHPSATAMARLQAKRQELQGLLLLKEQSARLSRDITKLGDNVDALVEGGEAVASVMSSWAGVFRAIQIARGEFAESLASRSAADHIEGQGSAHYVPDTLVRLPIDVNDGAVQESMGS